ncbi:CDP-alcohol phosphatidyltransferase family protein [Nitrosococcus wardiae]|uniref:CDP-alcohol phosphatidyltransferase family protein n=1 Tax=Nitrosococcus wardiae TaxID=1814290 RepID=A0A4P7BWH4_9GAMM|nr:CDP-alcohol phosphatidyltransferase family protein [Nitrosococcus wardiae]QBQ53440.1 CDP-alcohol phosphatidyltransferase family protein [Nitrosococcus wardiae]
MTNTPWDARLAALIVRPLCNSWVTPNHLTTLRLVTGLGAALCFGSGEWLNLAAWLWVMSTFLDHTDGELARMSGKQSRGGHFYDLATDAVATVGLFIGIGWGLTSSHLGEWTLLMGGVAGIAIAIIFHFRNEIEQRSGKIATKQPSFAGFEPEDTLYLLPLIMWLDGLILFLLAATLITPIIAILVGWQYFAQPNKN